MLCNFPLRNGKTSRKITPMADDKILWEADRSFQGTSELIRLEEGEYKGYPTFKLRKCFLGRENRWFWAQTAPDPKGRHWAVMNLKARELESLGKALLAAAASLSELPAPEPLADPVRTPERAPARARSVADDADFRDVESDT